MACKEEKHVSIIEKETYSMNVWQAHSISKNWSGFLLLTVHQYIIFCLHFKAQLSTLKCRVVFYFYIYRACMYMSCGN